MLLGRDDGFMRHAPSLLGRAARTDFLTVGRDVLIAVPEKGARETAITARAHMDLVTGHFRSLGAPGALIVMVDRALEQDAGARAVYVEATKPEMFTCVAFVGGTMLGRAIASVYVRLTAAAVPTRLFGTFDEALRWARDLNAERDVGAR
jgi:hypothetical protein